MASFFKCFFSTVLLMVWSMGALDSLHPPADLIVEIWPTRPSQEIESTVSIDSSTIGKDDTNRGNPPGGSNENNDGQPLVHFPSISSSSQLPTSTTAILTDVSTKSTTTGASGVTLTRSTIATDELKNTPPGSVESEESDKKRGKGEGKGRGHRRGGNVNS